MKNCEAASLALPNFVDHAAAEIEDDADGNGDIFGREIPNLLLDVVFEDTKVIWLKPRNLAVVWIGNGNVDKRQVHIDMQGLAALNDLARCAMLHVVVNGGLGDRGPGEIPDGDAKKEEEK